MKKSIKDLSSKAIKNVKTIKGGEYGTGTRTTTTQANNKAELL